MCFLNPKKNVQSVFVCFPSEIKAFFLCFIFFNRSAFEQDN
jgi:hypothetical protein